MLVLVRLGQIRLGFFFTANCSTVKNPRAAYTKPAPNVPPNSRNVRQIMNASEKLEKFCMDFINKRFEDFIDFWP